MNSEQKQLLRIQICKFLQNCQNTSNQKSIKELKQLFYKEKTLAKEYQKYFAGVIWQVMILPFQEKKCPGQEKICKVFTDFVVSAGTDTDIQSFKFPVSNLKPLFYIVLYLYTKQHCDARQLVRQRTIEVVYKILSVHFSHPILVGDEVLKKNVIMVLRERIRDKIPTIRTLALKCFAYLITDIPQELSDVIQDLRFHADFDPHSDARKSALSTLTKRSDIPVKFYIKKMYDKDENIRIEAFKALLNVPLHMLQPPSQSPSPLLKIIQWGLLQTVTKFRELLTQELIPMWIEASHGIINFLRVLDVARNSQTAGLLLQAMYPDDSEETLGKADLSFLTNDKIIEVKDISVEKTIYWVFLCRKFRNRPYCREKLFPDVAALIRLMKMLISVIHKENKEATRTGREEDIENILVLAQLLRIACICEYEEGSKGQMKNLVETILQDQILDESSITHSAVDLIHKIEPEFNTFMVSVIKKVLGTSEPIIINTQNNFMEEEVTTIDDDDDDIVFIKEVKNNNSSVNTNFTIKKENNPQQQQNSNANSSTFPHHSMANQSYQDNSDENEISGLQCDSNKRASVSSSRPLTEDETRKFKNERGEIIVNQHRLKNRMDKAIKEKDYLQANVLKIEHESLQQRRTQIDQILKDGVIVSTNPIKQTCSTSNQLAPDGMLRNDKEPESIVMSPVPNNVNSNVTDSMSHNHANQFIIHERREQADIEDYSVINETQDTLPSALELRGIVMFFRYVSWQQELTPFAMKMYENSIFRCLEEDDYRIRLYAVLVIGLIGLIDVNEAKKSLAVMIHALSDGEHEHVRGTAFKVIIDLLLRHSYFTFRVANEEDTSLWPSPLKDFHVEISEEEMEKLFIELLQSLPKSTDRSSKNWCLKYSGFMKLLIRGRIRIEAERILCEILEIWSNTNFTGTPLLRTISHFLPIYATMSLQNATRIGKAFIECVKKSIVIRGESSGVENGDSSSTNVEEKSENHMMALANFVFPQIHEEALKQFPQGSTVQSQLALDIITEISENIDAADRNLTFVKILRKLDIHEPHLTKVQQKIQKILNDIRTYEGTKTFQTAISNLQKYLTKKFGCINIQEEINDDESSRVMVTDNDSVMDMTENFEQLHNQQQRMRSEVDVHGSDEGILGEEDELLLEN